MTTLQRIWRLKNTILNLVASRCLACGYVTYPPKMRCPVCGSRELREERLPREGEVLSYTIIRVPAKGFENFTPVIIALIKLGDAKVLSEVVDVKPEDVSIGMRVVATVRKSAETIDGGVPYVTKFKPLKL